MTDILHTILQTKQREVAQLKNEASLETWQNRAAQGPSVRGFIAQIYSHIDKGRAAIIAEIKKASPSKGVIREDFDPVAIAQSYAQGGASCLSVLTDRDFFQGDNQYLINARHACQLPVLRKDFIIDEFQVYEARAIGADAILLIVAALNDQQLTSLGQLANQLGMDVLIEVHDSDELTRALAISLDRCIIGVNNRNLKTFETRLDTTIELLKQLPNDSTLITESGILCKQDVQFMHSHGIYGFLVGEAFMRAENPGQELKTLFSL